MRGFREIKFRGKKIIDGEWAYGSLLFDDRDNTYQIVYFARPRCSYYFPVDPETIGQYTNIKDSAKEIYEDDIVEIFYDDGGSVRIIVEWSISDSQWSIGFPLGVHGRFSSYKNIGNIHDNPELEDTLGMSS